MTPHHWGQRNEINEFVERASLELAERGHRVVVAAPSGPRGGVREARRLIDAARERPEALFDGRWRGERAGGDGGPPVLPVGPGCRCRAAPGPRAAPVPLDLSRALEDLLGGVEFDIVHVHDPFAPSASSVALRHSRSLNVGSFHEPSERVLSTQVARPLVEIFFGRLDARTASCGQTDELMRALLPRRLRAGRAGACAALEGCVAGPRAAGRRAPGRSGSPSASRRSAARCACSCGRCGGSRVARLGGSDLAPRSAVTSGCRSGCASACTWCGPRDRSRRTS